MAWSLVTAVLRYVRGQSVFNFIDLPKLAFSGTLSVYK